VFFRSGDERFAEATISLIARQVASGARRNLLPVQRTVQRSAAHPRPPDETSSALGRIAAGLTPGAEAESKELMAPVEPSFEQCRNSEMSPATLHRRELA
jgi:hypothetical protein